jgi:uncharacterized protein
VRREKRGLISVGRIIAADLEAGAPRRFRHIMLAADFCPLLRHLRRTSRAPIEELEEQSMTLSMYQASVPVLVRGLTNLKNILGKAQAHAAAKQIDQAAFVGARLFPDMLPLNRQVHIATDTAKGCAARLAGVEAPKFEDVEVTFDELCERLDKTIAYLKEFTPAQIDGSEARNIVLKMRTGPIEFTGASYLLHFVIPNFHFHVTTAYDILRHNGVEIGKLDYLGKPD